MLALSGPIGGRIREIQKGISLMCVPGLAIGIGAPSPAQAPSSKVLGAALGVREC